jgi:hypothetical protein
MNDILLKNVYACENDHNLVFTHVPLQCSFTCAIKYFDEWEFHHINNIGRRWLYMPQAPSLSKVGWYTWVYGIRAAFSTLRVIMAAITLFFYETLFFHFQCVHVVECNGCY